MTHVASGLPGASRRPLPLAQFGVLVAAGCAGLLALVPYLLPFLTAKAVQAPIVPVLLRTGSMALFIALFVALGLYAAPRVGLGSPIVDAMLAREPLDRDDWLRLERGLLVGLFAGTLMLALLLLVFLPSVPQIPFAAQARIDTWRRVAGAVHSGITQELILRFGFVSIIAFWITIPLRQFQTRDAEPTIPIWIAVVSVALLFGALQLAMASITMPVTGALVAAVLVINGIAGVGYGFIYVTEGLEAAVLAHIAGDVMLHVIGPSFVR